MNDIIEIVQTLEDSKAIQAKEQKGGFLGMLLGTLAAGVLGKMLARRGIVIAGSGNKKRKGIVKAGYGMKQIFNRASSFNNF